MPLRWNKRWVSDETYESAGVFDVNGDGVLDIVSGGFWYEGPGFRKKHSIGSVSQHGEYFDDFSTIELDVNGDGRPDFVTGGWWGNTLRWRENPEDPTKEWPEHVIAETGNIETTRAWDIDGDGVIEIVPNTPGRDHVAVFKLKIDTEGKGAGEFDRHVIHTFNGDGEQRHGLGCGDVAGNGRMDIVLHHGWLEAPEKPWEQEWTWHAEDWDFGWGASSVPMLVVDVNGDGLNDIIVGNGHGYGLTWIEQGRDAAGKRTWTRHPIDPFNATYHDMMWIDIDGDGECELVTGKRHRAHCGNDPGEWDDYGMYYFKWTGEGFAKQVIDYGRIGAAKGCGIYFAVADLTGNGLPDIVAPGKDGLFIFENRGLE